jgi:hypothetical protein
VSNPFADLAPNAETFLPWHMQGMNAAIASCCGVLKADEPAFCVLLVLTSGVPVAILTKCGICSALERF